ncbi:MAG: hypothetical protein ACRESR_08000 [Gammaproteobacteria bacterium]
MNRPLRKTPHPAGGIDSSCDVIVYEYSPEEKFHMYKPWVSLFVLVAASAVALPAVGAESVNSLLANGEQVVSNMHKANAKVKKIQQKSQARTKKQAAINKERAEFQQAAKKHDENVKKINKKSREFNLNCSGNMAGLECPRMREQLTKLKKKTNAEVPKLQAQQADLQKKLNQFNSQGTAMNQAATAATQQSKQAYAAEEAWLNKAFALTSSSEFRRHNPHFKAAGCPSSGQSATTTAAVQKMADQMLACLHKLAG